MHAASEEGTFAGQGGLQLYYQRCAASGEPRRATVGIVHGLGEHSGRYQSVIERLCPEGFDVWAFDLRGHGRSPGTRVHINNWSEYSGDLAAFIGMLQDREPALPLFLYGHSMGSLIALDYLTQERSSVLRGVILSGMPLEPANLAKPHLVFIARMLSRIWPTFSLSIALDPQDLSRDLSVVAAYAADPLVSHRLTVRFGTESLAAVARCRSRMSELNLPVLLIHGESDRLILPKGSRALYEALSCADKTLRIYPGGYHEPHNDLDAATVLKDTVDWLIARS